MTHDVDVLVIGAVMSGIGLAIQLIRQHKTRSFELIEKSESVAGTLWVNSYPGCGCDVSQPLACNGVHTHGTNRCHLTFTHTLSN